jgi:hypothetical protein
LAKPIKWIQRKQSRVAEGAMMLFIGILIAKLAVSSGSSIHLIFEMGPALMLQELGHLATILIALPVALLLGFKREAIGMTNSIGREPEVAVVVDKYTRKHYGEKYYRHSCVTHSRANNTSTTLLCRLFCTQGYFCLEFGKGLLCVKL